MIELNYQTVALGSVLIACLGFLLSTAITHALGKDRDRGNRQIASFNKSAINFTHSFNNVIELLITPFSSDACNPPMDGNNVHTILKTTFIDQYAAVRKFSETLNSNDLASFTNIWEKYCYQKNTDKAPDNELMAYFFTDYISGTVEEEKYLRKKAITHIENLLSFAKIK